MEFKRKSLKNSNPETYWAWTLISFKIINTCQVWSINLVLFNWLFKALHEKTRNEPNDDFS